MYGAIVAALGAGEILGTFVVAQLRVRRVGLVIYAWALLSAVVSVIWGLVPLLPVILVCAVIRGVSIVGFSVLWETSLQRHVPRELLGRVSSIDWFGGVLLVPVAPVAFAVIVEQTGPATSFVIGGSAAFLFILSGLAVRSIRELE
jgi:MFS family permease